MKKKNLVAAAVLAVLAGGLGWVALDGGGGEPAAEPVAPMVASDIAAVDSGRPDQNLDPPAGARTPVSPASAVRLVVRSDELPVAGAKIARLEPEQLTRRVVRGKPQGASDAEGAITVEVPDGIWPVHLMASAAGFLPQLVTCAAAGDYVVQLERGHRLTVEVKRSLDGQPMANCALLASVGPLGPFDAMLDLAEQWQDGDLPIDSRAGILRATTDAGGIAVFDALPEGTVGVLVSEVSVHGWKYDPHPVVVPETRHLCIQVQDIYVVALKTPGDDVVDVGRYRLSKARMCMSTVFDAVAREARERMGPGLCLPLLPAAGVSEAEFLAWEVKGKIVLRKRGTMDFVARPMRLADIENAPVLDLSGVPEQVMGEAVLAPEPDQADLMVGIDGPLVSLMGVSDGAGLVVHLSAKRAETLPPGTYRCMPYIGGPEGTVVGQETVTVTAGGQTQVPVRLEQGLVPLRLRIVNERGLEYQGGMLSIRSLQTGRTVVSQAPTKSFATTVHWLPPGKYVALIQVDVSKEGVTREIEVPHESTEPVDLRIVLP